jgi:hypothetical protein
LAFVGVLGVLLLMANAASSSLLSASSSFLVRVSWMWVSGIEVSVKDSILACGGVAAMTGVVMFRVGGAPLATVGQRGVVVGVGVGVEGFVLARCSLLSAQ